MTRVNACTCAPRRNSTGPALVSKTAIGSIVAPASTYTGCAPRIVTGAPLSAFSAATDSREANDGMSRCSSGASVPIKSQISSSHTPSRSSVVLSSFAPSGKARSCISTCDPSANAARVRASPVSASRRSAAIRPLIVTTEAEGDTVIAGPSRKGNARVFTNHVPAGSAFPFTNGGASNSVNPCRCSADTNPPLCIPSTISHRSRINSAPARISPSGRLVANGSKRRATASSYSAITTCVPQAAAHRAAS